MTDTKSRSIEIIIHGQEYIGEWSGTTSQGYSIDLKVEEIGGIVGVTQVEFKLSMYYSGWNSWSCTTGGTLKFGPPLKIVDNKFDESGYDLSIDGVFTDPNTLSGNISGSNTHPQYLTTAHGSATYNASKK